MRVVLTGGATGGHTTPLLAIGAALRRSHPGVELFFEGVVTKHVRELFTTYDIPAHHIPSGKIRRYPSVLNIFDLAFRLPLGLLIALGRLWWLMPDVVISKGGYGSIPPVLAAWFYRIPILLHESDVRPGLANQTLARFAAVIAVGFAESAEHFGHYQRKAVVTGTPVRFDFAVHESAQAKEFFGFRESDVVVLVTGGSQGAQQLNEVLLKILPQLITEVSIIHLTGVQHFDAVSAVTQQLLAESAYKKNYKVFPALNDKMSLAFSAADIIVSRAGATTLAEIARLRKPALLIPLPESAQDNQQYNAAAFERQGAARVLDSTNLGPHLFHRSLEELIKSPHLREQLRQKVGQLDHPEAAARVAALALTLATGLRPAYAR